MYTYIYIYMYIYCFLVLSIDHMITRMGAVLLDYDVLTCDVYNMQFICSVASYHNRLLMVAWKMIDDELLVIDGTDLAFDQRLDDYRKDVIKHTYSRGFSFVRARLGEDEGRGETTRAESWIGTERTVYIIV